MRISIISSPAPIYLCQAAYVPAASLKNSEKFPEPQDPPKPTSVSLGLVQSAKKNSQKKALYWSTTGFNYKLGFIDCKKTYRCM